MPCKLHHMRCKIRVIPSGVGQEKLWDFQCVFNSLMGGKGDSPLDHSLTLTLIAAN